MPPEQVFDHIIFPKQFTSKDYSKVLFLFFVLVPAILFSSGGDNNGIKTQNNIEAEKLVKEVFIKGSCENVFNIKAIGSPKGIGLFENGSTSVGMNRGIILSTGPTKNAEGPNKLTNTSGDFGDLRQDKYLQSLAPGNRLSDAVGIEFDFIPLDSFVTFRYVFASEEYCEFVGSIYNDVFGFFISGPGINGPFYNQAVNVALIPGSKQFVAINSVNHANNSQYFQRNELAKDANRCNIPPAETTPYQETIEYDGFTKVLVAELRLIPCETYHLRMVITDVGDNFYDSAVFLEAESFNIGDAIDISAPAETAENAVEGCSEAYFLFQRANPEDLSTSLTVNFNVSSLSEAKEGLDFAPLPNAITIPAGELYVKLPVTAINDRVQEPPEKLILVLDIPCGCYVDSAYLLIFDAQPLLVNLAQKWACESIPTVLKPTIQGGRVPFTYNWSTGENTPTISPVLHHAQQYRLTVTDACKEQSFLEVTLDTRPPPQADLSGDTLICEGDTAGLLVRLDGLPPWNIAYTVDGNPRRINEIVQSPYYLRTTEMGIYNLNRVEDSVCEGTAGGQGSVKTKSITVEEEVEPLPCHGDSSAEIRLLLPAVSGPVSVDWVGLPENSFHLKGLKKGFYRYVITDTAGCKRDRTIEILDPPGVDSISFDCNLLKQGKVVPVVSGGNVPLRYSIDGVHFYDESLFMDLMPGATYALTIQDVQGCKTPFLIKTPRPLAHLVLMDSVIESLYGSVVPLRPSYLIPESDITHVVWNPPTYFSCSDCLFPELTVLEQGKYTLKVTDNWGCTEEVSSRVVIKGKAKFYVPNAFSPNDDFINDRFSIYSTDPIVKRVVSFRVFSRWGALVYNAQEFSATDTSMGWDGRSQGQMQSEGVYVYHIQIELVNGKTVDLTGSVSLIR